MSATSIESEPEVRLVNCQQVHDLHIRGDRVFYAPLGTSDGDPARALRDALTAKADGLLITDARSGEQWYIDCGAVIRHDFDHQLAFVRRMDAWHHEQGHVLCWCSRWIHPDDLYEGTCGAIDCQRREAMDAVGLVP